MRILIELSDEQIKQLNNLSETANLSRDELIRSAITEFLAAQKPLDGNVFGLWKDRQIDGMNYQRQARSEW